MTPVRPQPSFDPGLTNQYTGALLRTINKDGSLNVRRTSGFRSWFGSSYMYLITMSWPRFLGMVLVFYLVVSTI